MRHSGVGYLAGLFVAASLTSCATSAYRAPEGAGHTDIITEQEISKLEAPLAVQGRDPGPQPINAGA